MTLTSSTIDNGARLPVECRAYSGLAGVRCDGADGEFACFAKPSALPETVGKVGGRPVRILAVRKSSITDGMIVVRFTYDDEQP